MRDDDKFFKGLFRAAVAAWVVGGLVSLALGGAIIWAVVSLVQHFTS